MAKYISNIWTTTLYLFTNGEDNTVHCVSKRTLYSYTPHIAKTHSLPETVRGAKDICGFGSFICPCIWKDRNHRKEDISSTLRKKLVQWKVQRFGSKISWKVT